MQPILEIKGISKKFRIHHEKQPYLSMRDSLVSLLRKRGGTDEDFWALRDVTFDVYPGESIGIIGKNGAGKSTLLKILSKITPPTSGKIITRGRIASLLEVGTGFHPELTGRENIFLNGSILGMRKAEVIRNFDAIVDFAGVEMFIDTPLKHYSSGMQLRLAFAVAAFLENEILIIDEVLAVGDAEFQKKCMGKMEDVSRNQGRTVLFVSHNMPSLKAICSRGVLLQQGRVAEQNEIEPLVNHYLSQRLENKPITEGLKYFQSFVQVHDIRINGSSTNQVMQQNRMLEISLDVSFSKNLHFELDVHLKRDEAFVASYSNFVFREAGFYEKGRYTFDYKINLPQMRSGHYQMDLFFTEPFATWYAVTESAISVDIINDDHHIFLNNASLRWGSSLLEGDMTVRKKNP